MTSSSAEAAARFCAKATENAVAPCDVAMGAPPFRRSFPLSSHRSATDPQLCGRCQRAQMRPRLIAIDGETDRNEEFLYSVGSHRRTSSCACSTNVSWIATIRMAAAVTSRMITVIITVIWAGNMLQLSLLKAAIGALAASTRMLGAKASSRPWQKHGGTVQINRTDYPRRDPCPAFRKYRQEHSRLCECKEAINKSLKYKDGVMAVGYLAKDAPRPSAILIGGHRKPAHDCPISGAITSNFSGTVSAAGRCFDITGAVETWRQSGPRLDRQRQGKAV